MSICRRTNLCLRGLDYWRVCEIDRETVWIFPPFCQIRNCVFRIPTILFKFRLNVTLWYVQTLNFQGKWVGHKKSCENEVFVYFWRFDEKTEKKEVSHNFSCQIDRIDLEFGPAKQKRHQNNEFLNSKTEKDKNSVIMMTSALQNGRQRSN